jgi:hypothetical protein
MDSHFYYQLRRKLDLYAGFDFELLYSWRHIV